MMRGELEGSEDEPWISGIEGVVDLGSFKVGHLKFSFVFIKKTIFQIETWSTKLIHPSYSTHVRNCPLSQKGAFQVLEERRGIVVGGQANQVENIVSGGQKEE